MNCGVSDGLDVEVRTSYAGAAQSCSILAPMSRRVSYDRLQLPKGDLAATEG